MKKLSILFTLLIIISCNSQDKRPIAGASEFQKELNAQYKDASRSPLKKKDLKKFKGLDFYPIDSTFRVLAKLTKTVDAPIFEMQTTTDRKPLYKKYGTLHFTIQNKEFSLAIFKSEDLYTDEEYKDYLFLPFLDKTSGTTSYAGGRFIEVYSTEENDDGTIIIDFNKAYNPYCAYNKKYSCPITPQENYLDVEIKAGVMAFKK